MAYFFGGSRYTRQVTLSIPRGLPPEMEYAVMRRMGEDFIDICVRMLPFYPIASKKGRPPYSKSGTLLRSLDFRVVYNRLFVYMVSYGKALHEGLNRPFVEEAVSRLDPRMRNNLVSAFNDASDRDATFQDRFDVFDLFGWFVRGLAWLDRIF